MTEYKIDASEDHWPIYIDGLKVNNDVVVCMIERMDRRIEQQKAELVALQDSYTFKIGTKAVELSMEGKDPQIHYYPVDYTKPWLLIWGVPLMLGAVFLGMGYLIKSGAI